MNKRKPVTKDTHVLIRVTSDLKDAVAKAAFKEGISAAEFVRRVIREEVEKTSVPQTKRP